MKNNMNFHIRFRSDVCPLIWYYCPADSNNGRTWVEEEGKEVRRSQRDRHRPLRWWEGEKPIYERRNASMSSESLSAAF